MFMTQIEAQRVLCSLRCIEMLMADGGGDLNVFIVKDTENECQEHHEATCLQRDVTGFM